jgi:PKD repeat protein
MSRRNDPRHRARKSRLFVLLAILTLVASATPFVAPVAAANQTKSTSMAMSGGLATNITWHVEGACDDCVPDDLASVLYDDDASYVAKVEADVHVTQMTWTSQASIDVTFDDQLLRQGQTIDLKDKLTVTGGTMTATGTISGSMFIERDGTTNVEDFGAFSAPLNLSWPCAVPLPGESPRPCPSGNADTQVFSLKIIDVAAGSAHLTLKVGASLTANVSTNGVVSSAALAVVGGAPAASQNVSWLGSSPSTTTDSRSLPCTAPAGNDVTYRFTGGSTTGATQNLASTSKLIGSVLVDPAVGPDIEGPDITIAEVPNAAVPLAMGLSSGNSDTLSLGTLAANNQPPVADAGGGATHTYSGNQGSPITFDGSGSSSVCGFPTLRWDFSDGGVAFGKNPQHTFQGSGTYSGLLTATDATGLTSTTTFSVLVTNLAPVVTAGPDTSAAWGRLVDFNGAGTDPGTDDQATLTYSWSFGDGTPSATGGPFVRHAYAVPGSYTATLTVCDRHNLCASDTRVVQVAKRGVSLGSLGETAATYDTPSSRHAALVDEFGAAVNGRTIEFTVAGVSVGTSETNASGTAQLAWTPLLDAGTYPAGAGFAGDALYKSTTGGSGAPVPETASVVIARKATSVTYTGTLKGAPNKTTILSAVLKDATGTALGGRTVVFVLGSQTINATTDATGVATATLKLTQKNGTYPLTATWTPAGPDAGRYTGSGASAAFKLQAK